MRRKALLGGLVVALLLLATPAMACSPFIHHVTEETPGVFEQETIAVIPSLGIREAKSASVVVRFWGQPPGHLGIQYHGGGLGPLLASSSCGPHQDTTGALRYGTPEFDYQGIRATAFMSFSADFSGEFVPDNLDRLDEMFGPPTVLTVDSMTIIRATAGVWLPTVLVFTGILAGLVLLVRFIRRRRRTTSAL